jgi:hypothetical protein
MLKEWSKIVFAIWLILFSLGHLPTFAFNPIMLAVVATIYFVLVFLALVEKKK